MVLAVDILKQFFTGYHTSDGEVEMRLRFVAMRYLKAGFALDALATVPGLVTAEYVHRFYYFKLIRYTQISRLFKQINAIFRRVERIWVHN